MRRRAREVALQVLYQVDVQPELDPRTALARFYAAFASSSPESGEPRPASEEEGSAHREPNPPGLDEETRQFVERLVRGVVDHLAEIDRRIVRASKNWRLERMGRVDRTLLRIATYELAYCSDVPDKVAINEAIEVAKRFGEKETPAFVNGILDRVLEELPLLA